VVDNSDTINRGDFDFQGDIDSFLLTKKKHGNSGFRFWQVATFSQTGSTLKVGVVGKSGLV